MTALRRLRTCADCDAVLNAGNICERCGVTPIDIDCQQAVEHVRGAVLFARPHVSREKSRSDGR